MIHGLPSKERFPVVSSGKFNPLSSAPSHILGFGGGLGGFLFVFVG